MKSPRILLLTLTILSSPWVCSAQTSGTLATQTNVNWTAAPWTITSGTGTYPNGGGTATLNTVTNAIIGTPSAGATITLDAPITLSGLTYNTPFSETISGTATNTLILASTGATFNVLLSAAATPSVFPAVNVISAPISGGGTAGLTKIGVGTITLSGTNTYTGGTHINGGTLALSGSAGDALFGATGAGNDISIDGGILQDGASAFTTARNVTLGGGGAIVRMGTSAMTINGVISGNGSLRRENSTGALILGGANTYTGTTTQTVGVMTLNGASGTIATSSGYDIAGTLKMDNTAANNNNRLSATTAFNSRGANINLLGNSAAPTSEVAGALNLVNGGTNITVTPNASQAASLNFASINRQNNSTLFVIGSGLGSTPGAGVATITSATAPGALIGGGGAAGTTTQSILPYAYGSSGPFNTGSTQVTYDASTGSLRPLLASEYATTLGVSPLDNVIVSASAVAPTLSTVNSLLFAPPTAATLSGGTIAVTSGSLVYSPINGGVSSTLSAGLNFGSAEGVIHATSNLTISGAIAGTGGLTIDPSGSVGVILTGTNTYTGTTTINGGSARFGGLVANDGVTPGPFGLGTSAIVLNIGSSQPALQINAVFTTLNRDLLVTGNPSPNVGASLTPYGQSNFVMNGNIRLQAPLFLGAADTAALGMTINGVISGPSILTDGFSSFQILNGANTYSGGTDIVTGTYALGSSSTATTGPLGTGAVTFSDAGTIQSSNTTARTISNNMVIATPLSTSATSNPTFAGTGALTFTGNVDLTGSRGMNVTDTAGTTFTGVISDGSLRKFGTGVLGLNSATGNTYNGGTLLGASAGTLSVNNTSGSGTGAGTVSIGTGSTLSGNFAISGATLISGSLSPGYNTVSTGNNTVGTGTNAIGTANFGSSLSFGTAATSLFEIASATSFDQLNVSGLLTLNGTITVNTLGGFVAQLGQSFKLVGFGSINATGFNPATQINLSGAQTAPGTGWDTSTFLTNGMITVNAVPEPSTWATMGAGVGVLFAMMRFRRRLS